MFRSLVLTNEILTRIGIRGHRGKHPSERHRSPAPAAADKYTASPMFASPPGSQPSGHVFFRSVGTTRPGGTTMSVFVWVMIGVAFWHFAVLVPDRFYGGIIGALIAAVGGALISGYLLPSPGIPPHNPPGISEALWPVP